MSMQDQITKIVGALGSVVASVTSRGVKGALAVEVLDASGNQITDFGSGLVTEEYDYIEIVTKNAANDPLVIEYRSGGSTGTLVATLTLTYDQEGYLKTVTKS